LLFKPHWGYKRARLLADFVVRHLNMAYPIIFARSSNYFEIEEPWNKIKMILNEDGFLGKK